MTTTLERYAMRRRGRRKAKARRKRAAQKKYEARMAARQAAPPASPAPSAAAPGVVVTRLSLQAPQARRVGVAGDFNGWSPEAAPLARGPGGAWTGELRLPRGRHQYMFVVDGEWVTDPAAPVTLDDGFGHRNAVLDL